MRRYGLQDLKISEVRVLQKLTEEALKELKDLLIGDELRISEWMTLEIKLIEIGTRTLKLGDHRMLEIPLIKQKGVVKQFDVIINIWHKAFPLIRDSWRKDQVTRIRAAGKIVKMLKEQYKILA